jgi:hypothetical protein
VPQQGRYHAYIRVGGTLNHLACTADFFEAVCARKSAELQLRQQLKGATP